MIMMDLFLYIIRELVLTCFAAIVCERDWSVSNRSASRAFLGRLLCVIKVRNVLMIIDTYFDCTRIVRPIVFHESACAVFAAHSVTNCDSLFPCSCSCINRLSLLYTFHVRYRLAIDANCIRDVTLQPTVITLFLPGAGQQLS